MIDLIAVHSLGQPCKEQNNYIGFLFETGIEKSVVVNMLQPEYQFAPPPPHTIFFTNQQHPLVTLIGNHCACVQMIGRNPFCRHSVSCNLGL